MKPSIGSIAISKSGRIKGFCIVVKVDGNFCYVVDGKTKIQDKPKKKNIKHLTITEFKSEKVAELILGKMKVGRETIKQTLKSYE